MSTLLEAPPETEEKPEEDEDEQEDDEGAEEAAEEAEAKVETHGSMRIIDFRGDVRNYAWNGNPADRAIARAAFKALSVTGSFLAATVDAPGRMTQVRSFDEIEATEARTGTVEVEVTRPLVGG
jgi:hypothetical protein